MKKEIILKSGWIKIDKQELDYLRTQLRKQYEQYGGTKKFNSHLENYEELREIIKAKIDDLKDKEDVIIKINNQEQYDILPGNTFFRNFLYTNKNAEFLRFQEYNIDICYIFAFGEKRFDYLHKQHKQQAKLDLQYPADNYSFIVSTTLNYMIEADKISKKINEEFGFKVENDFRNTLIYNKRQLEDLYNQLDNNSYIIFLIGKDLLQNENSVKDLIDFTNKNLDKYLSKTYHIILDDIIEGEFNIFDSLGRSEILKYWKLRSEKVEKNHKLILKEKNNREIYLKLAEELKEIKGIILEINRILDLIRANNFKISYKMFINKINDPQTFIKLLPKPESFNIITNELQQTYKGIKIPSNNDPNHPEFPPLPYYMPKFPASKTFRIDIQGFLNVWLKDESTNPTGTHKDRLAWEVVIKYKSLIQGLKYKKYLPQMSIISSGSAAIAIQHLLNLYDIPVKLKVLIDKNLNSNIKESIAKIGCEIFETNLSDHLLTSDEIKTLTNNNDGIDITYRETLDPNQDNYYDWMSYEIIQTNPEYCFIPFGTGDLFINVLNIVKMEYFNKFIDKHDPRFKGNIDLITKCNFMGASSNKPDTKLDKLYSNFLPSLNEFQKYIKTLKEDYKCVGHRTGFYYVDEKFVNEAIEIGNSLNLNFEPSGLAGLALLLQERKSIPKDAKILIVNTGKTKNVDELLHFKDKIKKEVKISS